MAAPLVGGGTRLSVSCGHVWRYYGRVFQVFIEEPAFRALLLAASIVLATGTIFYHFVEDWGWLDSLYFCTVTLTTIGYGDLVPETNAGKIFTVVYVVLGVGMFATFITAFARAPFLQERYEEELRPATGLRDKEPPTN